MFLCVGCQQKLCVSQVAVALMQAMQLQAGRNSAQQAEAFARQLHNAWGVGRAGCNDGVLLLLSVQDRQVRLSRILRAMSEVRTATAVFRFGQRTAVSPGIGC